MSSISARSRGGATAQPSFVQNNAAPQPQPQSRSQSQSQSQTTPIMRDSRPLAKTDTGAASLHLTRALSRGVDPARETPWRKPWKLRVTPFEEVLNQEYDGQGTHEQPYLIDWLEEDKEDPQGWNGLYKWGVAVFVSFATLAISLSSSGYSGAIPSLRQEFPASNIVHTLGISLYVLGFSFGPLAWAPFSELLGRRNLFLATYVPLAIFSGVAIAAPNLTSILVFRFLAGAFGSSPLTNAGGTLADMFNSKQRGLALAVFAAAPFLGPALGPITGGFLGETAGWRWVLAYLTIFVTVILAIGFLLLPETYAPYLLRQRARKLSKATGLHYIPRMDEGSDVSFSTQIKIAVTRPWALLFLEPIALLLAIYLSIIYGTLYSLFAAFPIVFQQNRGWSIGEGGLAFLGVLAGIIAALLYIIFVENPRYGRISDRYDGFAPPEHRLYTAMIGAPLLTIGLVWFAATDTPNIHFIVPIIAGAPFGTAMTLLFISVQNYLIDAYLIYAASVLAGNSFMRSLLGFAFPLFTPIMYENLGVQLGAGIPAILSFVCLPIPFLFYKYGPQIRERCKYSAEALRQYKIMQAGSHRKHSVDSTAAHNKHDDTQQMQERHHTPAVVMDEEAAPESSANREKVPTPTTPSSSASSTDHQHTPIPQQTLPSPISAEKQA